jgi:cephalosporin hydroxylase
MNRLMKSFIAALVVLVVGLGVLTFRPWRAASSSPRGVPYAASEAEARASALRLAQDTGDWNNVFLGIPILQFPTDLMTYQRLLFDVKPDIVIETGTFRGGLTLYLAMLLENINEKGRVLTVDLDEGSGKEVLASPSVRQSLKDRIRFFRGSSTDPKIVEQMAALAKDEKVIVILDSLHAHGHVSKELELYSGFVQPGGYIVVNDTHLEGTKWLSRGDSGPAGAVSEFLSAHPEFKLTTPQPDFAVSCFHSGLLMRLR